MGRHWHRLRRFVAQKVLHTSDTPHAIALGAGLATLVAFLPLIGLQTVIAVGLAALLKANKAICVPLVWITNPFTWLPIYGACYGLGRLILASPHAQDQVVVLSALEQQTQRGVLQPVFWKRLVAELGNLGLELWVGCLIVGVVAGVAAYLFAWWGVSKYRERRRQRILRRNLRRSNRKSGPVIRHSEPV